MVLDEPRTVSWKKMDQLEKGLQSAYCKDLHSTLSVTLQFTDWIVEV